MGEVGRRQEHRAPARRSSTTRRSSSSATASTSRSPTTSSPTLPFYKPADDSPEMKYLHERAPGARRLPARSAARKADEARGADARERSRRCSTPTAEGREISTTHGLRAHAHRAAARQGDRQARGADRARRGAHLRHGRPVPPDRHLLAAGPALQAGGQRPGHVLQGGQDRPDPAGRHQRGGRACARGSRRRRRTRPTTVP